MYKQVSRLVAGLLFGIVPLWAAAGITTFPVTPDFGEPSYSQAEIDAAFGSGRFVGRQEAAGECIGNPKLCGCVDGISPCGISLSSVLSGASFGETEPNDHIVAADALIPETLFWGQSKNAIDQDWYYLTTVEPNQIVTINFTVPYQPTGTGGWFVSVRDAAGNIYAEFDTGFMPDNPGTPHTDESREIVYPTFLGHTGTYYVVVQPSVTGVQLSFPYVVAVVLEYSGLDNAPPDVNFHDVEIESNDTWDLANALTSGVTMYGLLSQTTNVLGPTPPNSEPTFFVQTDTDWFRYDSSGMEQISLAWCGREACSDTADWFVEVTNWEGTPLVSFNTDQAKTVRFGLADPGPYYLRTTFHRKTDAECILFSDTETECKVASFGCMVLSVTPGTPEVPEIPAVPPDQPYVPATPETFATCTYAPGALCGTEGEGGTVPCARTDIGASAEEGPVTDNPIWYWGEGCSTYGYKCLEYGPVNDTNALNVQYNFTWWGTKLVPLTNGTDAFDAYLETPGWYQDR